MCLGRHQRTHLAFLCQGVPAGGFVLSRKYLGGKLSLPASLHAQFRCERKVLVICVSYSSERDYGVWYVSIS